jgi:hypothetical protein
MPPPVLNPLALFELMVAVEGNMQFFLSLPLTPLTYQVVLAATVEERAKNGTMSSKASCSLSFISTSFSSIA